MRTVLCVRASVGADRRPNTPPTTGSITATTMTIASIRQRLKFAILWWTSAGSLLVRSIRRSCGNSSFIPEKSLGRLSEIQSLRAGKKKAVRIKSAPEVELMFNKWLMKISDFPGEQPPVVEGEKG